MACIAYWRRNSRMAVPAFHREVLPGPSASTDATMLARLQARPARTRRAEDRRGRRE